MLEILSEKQKTKLKNQLIEQKHSLLPIADSEALLQGSLRDSTDELSTVDNHPADLATELYEREKDLAISVHNKDELEKVTTALERMENDTYGICATCSEEIPYDRLRAIPYTAHCIEHSEANFVTSNVPSEDAIISAMDDDNFDDSFQIVAQYGTSETPSDFAGTVEQYDVMYEEQGVDGKKEIDDLHISETDQLTAQVSRIEAEQARQFDYTDE